MLPPLLGLVNRNSVCYTGTAVSAVAFLNDSFAFLAVIFEAVVTVPNDGAGTAMKTFVHSYFASRALYLAR